MLNPEYRTKEMLTDIIEVIKILESKGMKRVRPVFHTKNTMQFKPMFIIGYETPKKKDKYVMFTSKFYEDSYNKKTGVYSSIRLTAFHGGDVVTEKLDKSDMRAMTLSEFEDRPYLPKGTSSSGPASHGPVRGPAPDPDEEDEDDDDEDDFDPASKASVIRKIGKATGMSDDEIDDLLKSKKSPLGRE